MAIAGLPPLNGFASEWLTLQSLLHAALHRPVGIALLAGAALAALAATAALALLCFVKVVGLALLGAPRRAECAAAVDPADRDARRDGRPGGGCASCSVWSRGWCCRR